MEEPPTDEKAMTLVRRVDQHPTNQKEQSTAGGGVERGGGGWTGQAYHTGAGVVI